MVKTKNILLFLTLFLIVIISFDKCDGCVQNDNFYKSSDSNSFDVISEDNTLSKPSINFNFSFGNALPEFKEDTFKRKLGLDDKGFYLVNKHTCSSISIMSFNNVKDKIHLSFVVSCDNIIIFRSIQI